MSDFRLDKYEVTVGRFRRFVDAVVAGWRPAADSGKHSHLNGGSGLANGGAAGYEPGWDEAWNQASTAYRIDGTRADWDTFLSCDASYQTWTASAGSNETRPINCINWFQAYAFCIWDGGFLPSEAEWNYAAAGGSEQRAYPWGVAPPGANTNLAVYGCLYDAPGVCTGVENIAPVGSAPAGNGRYGQADLAGNVWEWNLDWSADYVDVTPCGDCAYLPPSASHRAARGGGYSYDASFLRSSHRSVGTPSSPYTAFGVRCARIP